MAIEYTLRANDSGIDIEFLKRLFEELDIEILDVQNLQLGFEVYKFKPDINLNLTFIKKLEKSKKHPSNYYETHFLKSDFFYNELLSYRFEKNLNEQQLNIQYNAMLASVFKVAKYLNTEVLFTGSGGEDKFIFKNQKYIVESSYYEYLNDTHKNIVENYDCLKFDGIPL